MHLQQRASKTEKLKNWALKIWPLARFGYRTAVISLDTAPLLTTRGDRAGVALEKTEKLETLPKNLAVGALRAHTVPYVQQLSL